MGCAHQCQSWKIMEGLVGWLGGHFNTAVPTLHFPKWIRQIGRSSDSSFLWRILTWLWCSLLHQSEKQRRSDPLHSADWEIPTCTPQGCHHTKAWAVSSCSSLEPRQVAQGRNRSRDSPYSVLDWLNISTTIHQQWIKEVSHIFREPCHDNSGAIRPWTMATCGHISKSCWPCITWNPASGDSKIGTVGSRSQLSMEGWITVAPTAKTTRLATQEPRSQEVGHSQHCDQIPCNSHRNADWMLLHLGQIAEICCMVALIQGILPVKAQEWAQGWSQHWRFDGTRITPQCHTYHEACAVMRFPWRVYTPEVWSWCNSTWIQFLEKIDTYHEKRPVVCRRPPAQQYCPGRCEASHNLAKEW